jgi:hypothetical protein
MQLTSRWLPLDILLLLVLADLCSCLVSCPCGVPRMLTVGLPPLLTLHMHGRRLEAQAGHYRWCIGVEVLGVRHNI